MRSSHALDFILAPVVFPLEGLEVAQVITTALGDRDNVVDFPAVAAACIAEVLPDNRPAPGIDPQGFINAHGSSLLPDGLNDLRAERIAIGICVRLSLHG